MIFFLTLMNLAAVFFSCFVCAFLLVCSKYLPKSLVKALLPWSQGYRELILGPPVLIGIIILLAAIYQHDSAYAGLGSSIIGIFGGAWYGANKGLGH